MTNPATAFSTVPREPDGALRSVLDRLAGDDCSGAVTVRSFEDLCTLVVRTVRETVLQRTYNLVSERHDGLCMTVSNRRLLSLCDVGSEDLQTLPDLPSSDVADVVIDRLRAACSSASEWSIYLSSDVTRFLDSGGSCSADILLSRMNLHTGRSEAAPARIPARLASLQIHAGPEPDIIQGDPALVAALKRISTAFLPGQHRSSVTGAVIPRRATLIPLSQDHVALLSEAAGATVLEAYRQPDATLAAQAWMDRQNRAR